MREKSSIMVMIAWAVTGTLLGVGGTLLLQPAEVAELPEAEIPRFASQTAPEREVEYSAEVDEWHRPLAPAIGNILTISGPILDSLSDFPPETACVQLEGNLATLSAAEPPPAEPLATYFAAWVEAVGSTVEQCRSFEGELTRSSAAALMQRHGFEMDIFLRELDRLIDLTRGPGDPPPGR